MFNYTDTNNSNMMVADNAMSATQLLIYDNVCYCGENMHENNLRVL